MASGKKNQRIIYSGHPKAGVPPGTRDPKWIKKAGAENWLSIVRGRQVLRDKIELGNILDSSARLVLLASASQWKTERIAIFLGGIMSEIQELSARPGPWIYYVIEDDHGNPDPELWTEKKLRELLANLQRREDRRSLRQG